MAPTVSSMSPELQMLVVNQPSPFGVQPEGVRCVLTGLSAAFLLSYNRPRPSEIAALGRGAATVGLARHGATGFFLLRVVGATDGFVDLPFHLGITPTRMADVPVAETGARQLVSVVLQDERAVVRALRAFTLSPEFSALLWALLREQVAERSGLGWSPERHLAEVAAIRGRYPTADALARAALVLEKPGL